VDDAAKSSSSTLSTVGANRHDEDDFLPTLPQAFDWDSWPTTYFDCRDGLVRNVHSGFSSLGSGELYRKEKQEFITEIERLFSENRVPSR
jgi:hypothetical protein